MAGRVQRPKHGANSADTLHLRSVNDMNPVFARPSAVVQPFCLPYPASGPAVAAVFLRRARRQAVAKLVALTKEVSRSARTSKEKKDGQPSK